MLAFEAPPFSREGWIAELKYDGHRVLVGKEGKQLEIRSRRHKNATARYPEVLPTIARLPGSFVIDGEVCTVDEFGRCDFESLQNLVKRTRSREPAPLVVFCFDLLFLRGSDLRNRPLLERKKRLRDLIPFGTPHLLYVDHVEGAGLWLYQQAVQLGIEGVMNKRADSLYVGRRSHAWLKSKQAEWHDGWKRVKKARPPGM